MWLHNSIQSLRRKKKKEEKSRKNIIVCWELGLQEGYDYKETLQGSFRGLMKLFSILLWEWLHITTHVLKFIELYIKRKK